jgi:hypothetical protein
MPSPSPLAREPIASAVDMDYQGVVVRVVRPEFLIALYLQPEATGGHTPGSDDPDRRL